MRRAAKVDTTQQEIVDAIRAEGWDVWIIKLPCDLFCWHPVLDVWQPLEVKSARKKDGSTVQDKRQEEQIKFLHRTRCPVVTTAQEALEALSRHYANQQALAALNRPSVMRQPTTGIHELLDLIDLPDSARR